MTAAGTRELSGIGGVPKPSLETPNRRALAPNFIEVALGWSRWKGARSEARIEPDCLSVIGDGSVIVALVTVSVAAVVVGRRQLGIEPDRLVVVGDGEVIIALGTVSVSAVHVGGTPAWDRA
jgi:hypothetical protein